MKDAKDSNVVYADDVGDSVVAIEKHSDLSFRFITVLMAKFRKVTQELSFFIDAGNDFPGCGGIILCYVVVNFFEPQCCFV